MIRHTTASSAKDIADAALLVEDTPLKNRQRNHLLEGVNAQAKGVFTNASTDGSADRIFTALNAHFFGPEGFAAVNDLATPENVSIAAVVDNRRRTCVGLAIVYLALAQRLGLDAHAVATPEENLKRPTVPGC